VIKLLQSRGKKGTAVIPKKPRRNHSAFKVKVALEALKDGWYLLQFKLRLT
jgi:hypothetical protein